MNKINESLLDRVLSFLSRLSLGVNIDLDDGVSSKDLLKFFNKVRKDPYLASLFSKAPEYDVDTIVLTGGSIDSFKRVGNKVYAGVDIVGEDMSGLQEFLTHEFVHRDSDHEFKDEVDTEKDSLERMRRFGIRMNNEFMENASFEPLMSHAISKKDDDELAFFFFTVVEESMGYPGKSNYLEALEVMSEYSYDWPKLKKRKFVNFELKPLFGLKPSIAAGKNLNVDRIVDAVINESTLLR